MAPKKGISSTGGSRGRGTWNIDVEIDPPIADIVRQYDTLREKLRDLRPAWSALVPQLRREMGRHFMSGGSATGTPWPPLKESYAARKTRSGLFTKSGRKRKRVRNTAATLVLTGKLLTHLTTKGVLSNTKRTLRFGVSLPYARAVNFGSKNQNIAQRPVVVATDRIRMLAKQAINNRIDQVLNEFGVRRGRSFGNTVLRRKAA